MSEREEYLKFLKKEKIGGKNHPIQKYVEEELDKIKNSSKEEKT